MPGHQWPADGETSRESMDPIVSAVEPHVRFREARERLGMHPQDVETLSGVRDARVWDIEACEGVLVRCYSPSELQRFCRVLRIHPSELFGDRISEPNVLPEELVRRIHEECRSRGVTLEQFEDAVGWRLSACMDPPEKVLEDLSIDGLQWLCREPRIDWRRAL